MLMVSRLMLALAMVPLAATGCKHWSEAERTRAESEARLAEAEIRAVESLSPELKLQWAIERERSRAAAAPGTAPARAVQPGAAMYPPTVPPGSGPPGSSVR